MPEYRMSKLVEKYYLAWVKGPTLLEHSLDRDRFYCFVKACMRYSRTKLHGGWLRYFLEKELPATYPTPILGRDFRGELISEVVILFERILAFNKASFPNHALEMRNPYAVMGQLRYHNRPPGEIEEILVDNFGPSWREDYRKKYT